MKISYCHTLCVTGLLEWELGRLVEKQFIAFSWDFNPIAGRGQDRGKDHLRLCGCGSEQGTLIRRLKWGEDSELSGETVLPRKKQRPPQSRIWRRAGFFGPGSAESFLCNLEQVPEPLWGLGFVIRWRNELEPGTPYLWLSRFGPSSSAIAGFLPPAVLHRSQAGSECRSSGLIFQKEVISPVLLGKKGSGRLGTEAVQYLAEKTAWGCVGALTACRTLTESAFQGSA